MTTFSAELRYNRNPLLILALAAISFSLLSAARGQSVIVSANCVAQDDTCFSSVIGSNRDVIASYSPYTFSHQVVINNVQNMRILCSQGTVITVPSSSTFLPASLFLISGSSNITIEGCEMTGQVFNSGTINSLAYSGTTATLSIAPTYPGPMANGWLTVPGTTQPPDASAIHAQGVTISSISGTGVTLSSPGWKGSNLCSSSGATCPFQIGYNLQNAIKIVDEQCAINSPNGISGSGTTVTVTTAASSNCSLSNGEFVTVFGTGTIAGVSFNNVNRGPITIISGCAGSGSCTFTYPDTTNPGSSGSSGTISLKSQHIFVRKNHTHHTVKEAIIATIGSIGTPPSEATSDLES